MSTTARLLDLGTVRRLVQQHVGAEADVIACWQPPPDIYRVVSDDRVFHFAIDDRGIPHVGGTRHVAIDRRTGEITELGMLGE